MVFHKNEVRNKCKKMWLLQDQGMGFDNLVLLSLHEEEVIFFLSHFRSVSSDDLKISAVL